MDNKERIVIPDLILEFMGGMGNQMFQYALYLGLLRQGKHVQCAVTNKWQGNFPFVLDLFPNVHYEEIDYNTYWNIMDRYKRRPFMKKVYNKIFPGTRELFREKETKGYTPRIYRLKNKIITGYFQDLKYIEPIEKEIRKAFEFPEGEPKLVDFTKRIREEGYVGVHIRRGDYLLYPEIFGGICDQEYYRKGIEYFGAKGCDRFLFFSNDMQWVRENYPLKNAVYFTRDLFENYQDWYDMYVMSQCRHNLIANSSFSWWGAWLNTNENHIVIAPKIWLNTQKKKNICPKEWIRI